MTTVGDFDNFDSRGDNGNKAGGSDEVLRITKKDKREEDKEDEKREEEGGSKKGMH